MSSPEPFPSSMGGLDYATFAWDHRVYRYMFLSGLVILFCSRMERGMEILLMVQSSLVETTLCVRVLAMYNSSMWVQVPLAIGGGVTGGLGVWTIIKYGEPQMLTAPGMPGCHTAIPRSTALRLAGVWEAQLVLDLMIFGLTLYKAYTDRAVISMVPGSLVERMMRDGAMYFGIIVLANLADLVTIYLGDVRPCLLLPHEYRIKNHPFKIMIAGILSWWTTSLSVTLISRLMLNLQRAGAGNSGAVSHYTTELETIHFRDQNPNPQPKKTKINCKLNCTLLKALLCVFVSKLM
ncbi:hypothetical protein MVEN_02230300 [Mycena venus]|uniref:Uncharacterized protein n=1 Tax=Mycena venus TaxID=2733690 RepID=A0A8H6X848_9AGAR|nr:hypothetical protein MVEN_02230300 [Mycena venus]